MLTEQNEKKYAYLCLMRPPTLGAVPKNGLDSVDFVYGESPSGHHYWGHAIYNRKLSEKEMDHYDMEETALCVTD